MVYIEHEGALYRGHGRAHPTEVYHKGGWKPYAGAGTHKPIDWGSVISEADAKALMQEIDA